MHHKQTPPPPQRTGSDELEKLVLRGLLIFFAAILVYIPAVSGGYIYDDDTLLTQNPIITRGTGFFDHESLRGLGLIWFPRGENEVTDYAPMASTTLWAEWRLWGEQKPMGYHATNILLHAMGALLLWMVLMRIRMPGACVAALIWAVHPVGVESVAWISERRNTLSMLMLMLTLLAWFRFQQTRQWRDYAIALVLFALTLLSKSTVVMLPFFLLLWVWWKQGRVIVRDVIEAGPFFILSLALGFVTVFFQYERAIANESLPTGGLVHRMASACFALGFYFYKTVFPFNLSFNYPEWHNQFGTGWQALPGVVFAAGFYWMWRNRQTWGKHAILGVGFFIIMIAPALGVMKMAYMRITLVADHFEYMPMAGLIAVCVAGAVWLRNRWSATGARYALDAATGVVLVIFSVNTWQRAGVFQDAETLWRDTLAKNPDAWQAHEHLGGILLGRNDYREALEHFRRGVEIRPWLAEVHNNYGNTLRTVGRMDEALKEGKRAVELNGESVPIGASYADTLTVSNHLDEATVQYRKVLKLNPANPGVCFNLGLISMHTGKMDDAIDYFREALRLAPDFQLAQQNLDEALVVRDAERKK